MALATRRLHHLTADEFFAMADRLPRHAQLIEGEVIVASPNLWHQDAVGELYHRTRLWIAEAPGRGKVGMMVDVKVDDRNVYEPDLWWFSAARPPRSPDARLPAVPDLVAEMLSPSTGGYDRGIKRLRYEQHGLGELWLISPRPGRLPLVQLLRRSRPDVRTFDVEVCLDLDDTIESPQLPGFSLKVSALFG